MRRSFFVQPTRRVYSYASPVNTRRDLFIATFGILALELAIIRWISHLPPIASKDDGRRRSRLWTFESALLCYT